MNRTCNTITALAFALLMALPLMFISGILLKQGIIRYQREQRMEKELLQTVTVATEKIHWIKKGKEILLEGRMFDIKNFRQQKDRFVLTGFFDDEEDALHIQMKNITGKKNHTSSSVVSNFPLMPVYNEPMPQSPQVNWQLFSNQYGIYVEETAAAPAPEIIHPPA